MMVETITVAIDILAGMLNTMTVNDKHMAESTEKDFQMLQSWLIILHLKGLPFREAHEIVGKLVLECTKAGYYLQDVPPERYQEVSDLIEEDIYETLNLIQLLNVVIPLVELVLTRLNGKSKKLKKL